jgi:hypothetical protein
MVQKSGDGEEKTFYEGRVAGDQISFTRQSQAPSGVNDGFLPPVPVSFVARRVR